MGGLALFWLKLIHEDHQIYLAPTSFAEKDDGG
ncbi:hypothetical protein SAMN05192574_102240 [Mucilaginibacter gossypiicola]|uniref:Uncharacterized protein n=1 Tax=Mucilaginibacter gossypiicola TaxID=551995 RepID=A0A1H8D9G4_9SPHI|nr:hypothetical protein SAMN05192574_102240 [Mucilaginibacter gossypiicola]